MDPTTLVRLLLGGLLLGSIYALVAYGLSLIFGVSRVLVITHGEFLMLSGLTSFTIFELTGLHPVAVLPFVLVLFAGLGVLFERLLIRPILNQHGHQLLMSSILVTLGVSLAISDVAAVQWGAFVKGVPQDTPLITIGGRALVLPILEFGGVRVSSMRLSSLALIVVIAIAIQLLLSRTFIGKAMRGVAQDRVGAALVGIDRTRVINWTFGLGTALAAAAGVLYLVLANIDPKVGLPLTFRALTVLIIGGVGSLPGAMVGGLLLGVLEVLVGFQFGLQWSETVTFLVLIAVLLIRPRGLFGGVE